MALILAVDPERTQSDALAVLARELRGHELLSAATCADALAAVDRRVPDLVLLPILLPEAEESELLSRLRERSRGRDVRALTIPLLKAARSRNGGSRWFGGGDNGSAEGCEPRVFADLIREYLAPLEDGDDHVDASPAAAAPPARESATSTPVHDDQAQPAADEIPDGISQDPEPAAADQFPLPAYAAPDRRARVLAAAFAAASWARARRAGWKDTPAFTAPPPFVPPPASSTEEPAADLIAPAAPVAETHAPAPPLVVEAPPPDAIPAFDHDELVAAIEAAAPPRADSKGAYASLEDAVAAVVVEPAPPEPEPAYERSSQPEFSHESVVAEEPARPARPEPEGPALGERLAGWAAALGGPMKRWAPRVAGLAVLIALGIQGRSYWARATAVPTTGTAVFESMPGGTRVTVDGMELGVTPATATLKPGAHTVEFRFGRSMRTRQITVNAGERTVERIDWSRKPSGTLQVSSTPSGAKVLVDGAERGTTPVTLDDLAAGTHTVVLQSSEGSIKRTVTIKADQTAQIDETIYSGWVTLYSPFELAITEGSRPLRLDDRNQVMLPAGPHDLRFENRTFGYSEVRHVDIQPGHGTTVSIAPPKSLLNVSASAPAEVLVDGASIGQTPITDAPIDIGTRDVVVRSASGEERRQTITVTTKPITLAIDFSK